MEKKWAADEDQQIAAQLDEVGSSLAASDSALQASIEALAAKMEQATVMAEAAASPLAESGRGQGALPFRLAQVGTHLVSASLKA